MRISIHGPSGAGKSTLGHILSEHFRLPLIHLDKLYPDTPLTREEKRARITDAASSSSWVIEGGDPEALPVCLNRSNVLVYLDRSRGPCLCAVFNRNILGKRQFNPDNIGRKRLTLGILNYILWYYPTLQKEHIALLSSQKAEGPEIHILKSRKDIAIFVGSVVGRKFDNGLGFTA